MALEDDTPAESGWVYRRWNTFITKIAIYLLLVGIVIAMGITNQPLMWVAIVLIIYGMVTDGLYMGGASVLDYAEIAKGLSGLRKKQDE
jgi:hypothetical protein